MLQKLNERIKGIVAWVVVLLIAFTFFMFGLDYFFQIRSSASSTAIAEVNGQPISAVLFEQFYRRLRQQEPSNLPAHADEVLKKQVVEELIVNTATLSAARRAGFYVSPAQVAASIIQIPQFQENGKFSSAKYQQVLAASLFTTETLQKEVEQGMLINQQRFAFVGSVFVLPTEVEWYAKLLFETRDYDYTILSLQSFIDKVKLDENALRAYHKAHAQELMTPARVSLDYVLLSVEQFKSAATVSEADVRQYYQDNLSAFKIPPRWKVAHLLYAFPEGATLQQQMQVKQKIEQAYQHLIRNPAVFQDWVKQHSDDRLSAQQGGLLPWLSPGQSEFDEMLMTLNQVGQLSQPFRTKRGYEMLKLLDYTPSKVTPLDQAQEVIRRQLSNEVAQKNYAKALEALGELSYQSPETLEPVSKTLHLPILHTKPFSSAGGTEWITQQPEVQRLAFSSDVKELGNNSEPIQVNPSTVAVIRVKEQFPATVQAFEAVRPKIEAILKEEAAKKEMMQLGNEIKQKHTDLPAQYRWLSVTRESHVGESKNPIMRDLAFSLPKMHQLQGQFLPNGDYVIVRLKAIYPGAWTALDQTQRQALQKQLESTYGEMDYDLYIKEVVDAATIKRYPLN